MGAVVSRASSLILGILSKVPDNKRGTVAYFLTLYTLYYLRFERSRPNIYHSLTPSLEISALLKECQRIKQPFYPHVLLPTGSTQTIAMELLIRLRPDIAFSRDLITTSDGAVIALDWVTSAGKFSVSDVKSLPEETPIIVCFPGMLGGSRESYLVHFLALCVRRRYRVVVYIRRGCGGLPLSGAPQNYSDESDVNDALCAIENRFPRALLLGVGFSLGANFVTRYVGVTGKMSKLKAVVSCCNPWDLVGTSYWLKHVKKFFQGCLVSMYKEMVNRNKSNLPSSVDPNSVLNSQCFRSFHENLHMKIFGTTSSKFKTLDDYLADGSSDRYIDGISVPFLAVSVLDDPICSRDLIPYAKLKANPNCVLVTTDRGGHHAFISNRPWRNNWLEMSAIEWFDQICLHRCTLPDTFRCPDCIWRSQHLEAFDAPKIRTFSASAEALDMLPIEHVSEIHSFKGRFPAPSPDSVWIHVHESVPTELPRSSSVYKALDALSHVEQAVENSIPPQTNFLIGKFVVFMLIWPAATYQIWRWWRRNHKIK